MFVGYCNDRIVLMTVGLCGSWQKIKLDAAKKNPLILRVGFSTRGVIQWIGRFCIRDGVFWWFFGEKVVSGFCVGGVSLIRKLKWC